MRLPIIAALLLVLAGASQAQRRDGTYKPANSAPVQWSINAHQTLIWGGQPYLPFGVRIDGTPQAVDAARSAGIKDVIVDLPANGAGWDPVVAALNKAGLRFLVRIDSLAPMAHGYAVQPQSYRVGGITTKREISLDIPGATSAFVVLANRGDGTVAASARVPITDGHFDYTAKPGPEVEHILLVYPEMATIEQTDYWEDLDAERDELLSTLRKHPLGPGLRGIVNPMGRGLAVKAREPGFVPTSPYFRMEMRAFLEEKYRNVEALIKNWGLTSSTLLQQDEKKNWLVTFGDIAKLVPLWSPTRGIGDMLDPDTDKIYPCDNKNSHAWSDITEVLNTAEDRRFSRIVPAIRGIVDVPVIQDWLGWAAPYENSHPILDGIGMRASGTTESALAESGSRAASSIFRWQGNGWLVTTDLDLGVADNAPAQLPGALDELMSMGAKGVFVRTESSAVRKQVAAEASRRGADTSIANSSPGPVFFPENACNPAQAQKLPGDHWWLPTPAEGNRIDLGTRFFAYRTELNDGTIALWARDPGRYRLLFGNPKPVRFGTLDGSDPQPKYSKNYVDVTLTQFPLVITGTSEVPVPQIAYLETVQRFRYMLSLVEKKHGFSEEMEMYFTNAMLGAERNPGGSFYEMRLQYWRLADAVSTYSWIEAEKARDTNFSEIIKDPSCSGGEALSLKTLVPPDPAGYFAEYNVPVKSREDQEVWLAAKIPAERRGDVHILIGGQQMRLTGDPQSLYGDGFGWYKLGTTRMAGDTTKVRLQVDTAGNAEIAVDAIMLTPGTFKPNGAIPPDPLNFAAIPAVPAKGSKRRGSGGS